MLGHKIDKAFNNVFRTITSLLPSNKATVQKSDTRVVPAAVMHNLKVIVYPATACSECLGCLHVSATTGGLVCAFTHSFFQ